MIFKSEESREKVLAAAKRGNETLIKKWKIEMEKMHLEYYADPKLCLTCNKIISYEKRRNSFCSHSCAASKNNLGTHRFSVKKYKNCFFCGKTYWGKESSFCSSNCLKNKRLQDNENLFVLGLLNDEQARNHFKRTKERICSICGLTEWTGKPIPLCVDHIDGNHNNNFPSNLRFICNNCDALLPTYKGANKGHGRTNRKK
jgi:hypothetical protein